MHGSTGKPSSCVPRLTRDGRKASFKNDAICSLLCCVVPQWISNSRRHSLSSKALFLACSSVNKRWKCPNGFPDIKWRRSPSCWNLEDFGLSLFLLLFENKRKVLDSNKSKSANERRVKAIDVVDGMVVLLFWAPEICDNFSIGHKWLEMPVFGTKRHTRESGIAFWHSAS